MLDFKLFGIGEVSYQGSRITGLFHQLPGHLICYLLLNRDHPQNREFVASIFWSDSSLHDSKKSLRNHLWRLRQTLQSAGVPVEAYLQFDEESISFNRSGPYALDIDRFENLIIPCKDLQGFDLSDKQVTDLETAVSLYTGDLLEGVYEDWCLYDRERLRMLFINVLHKLMVYYGCNQAFDRAIEFGKRLLSFDNTQEKIHRQLMLLYWMSGDRKAALTQYNHCRQVLREEVGCEPMQETRRSYKEMLHDQINPADWDTVMNSSTLVHAIPSASENPICKRIQNELHRLQEMIEDAQATSRNIEELVTEALNK